VSVAQIYVRNIILDCTSAQLLYYQMNLHRLHVSTINNHRQAYFCHLSHKMLHTLWDPIAFTSMEYIKHVNYFMYSMDFVHAKDKFCVVNNY